MNETEISELRSLISDERMKVLKTEHIIRMLEDAMNSYENINTLDSYYSVFGKYKEKERYLKEAKELIYNIKELLDGKR